MMYKLLKISNEWWYKRDCILQQFQKDGIEKIIERNESLEISDYQAFLYSQWKKYNLRYINCQKLKDCVELKKITKTEFNKIVKNWRTVESYNIKTNHLNLPIYFPTPVIS